MSLATRCTQCGTVFRVVQDQLKVSEGWVRCGRCDEVFNALEGLFDLGRDSPPPTPVSAAEDLVSHREDWRPSGNGSLSSPRSLDSLPAPLHRNLPSERQRESLAPSLASSRGSHGQSQTQSHPTRPSQFGRPSGHGEHMFEPIDGPRSAPAPLSMVSPVSAPAPLDTREPRPRKPSKPTGPAPLHESSGPETIIGEPIAGLDYAEARLTSELLVDPALPDAAAYAPGTPHAEAAAIAQQQRPAPAFVRKAESAERWQSPLAKASLTMLALLLALGLGLQFAHHQRDLLAARYPAAEPLLAQWCELAGCTIGPPKIIADVHIESSALTPAPVPAGAPESSSAVQLSVVLRNHGETRVALPSIDVTLTDGAGKTLSRRALSPADFGVKDPVLATGAEYALQAVLATGERKAAGYTVDVFYP